MSSGKQFKRIIYAYEFSDNHVYVGLTQNPKRRHREHLKEETSAVFKHIEISGVHPNYIIKTDFIDSQEAKILEGVILDEYISQGWIKLNKSKTGGLGGSLIIWNKENCEKEAKKYDNISNFKKGCPGAYKSASYNKWLDEICSHMIRQRIKKGKWENKELCIQEGQKYKNKSQFEINNKAAFRAAEKNMWMDEICKDMEKRNLPKLFDNKEMCKKEASKYNSRSQFNLKSPTAWKYANENNWLDEFFGLSKRKKVAGRGLWNDKEKCRIECSKYKGRNDLMMKNHSAYRACKKHEWLDEFFPINKKGGN